MTNFEHYKNNLTIFDLIASKKCSFCSHCPASDFCETVNNSCDETIRIWAVQEYKGENENA